jgi:hypothetical protein
LITQQELSKYEQDRAVAKDTAAVVDLKKAELMGRIDKGERVQKGPLNALIEESHSRNFSAKALTFLLGAEQTAALKAQLPETTSRSLKVVLEARW